MRHPPISKFFSRSKTSLAPVFREAPKPKPPPEDPIIIDEEPEVRVEKKKKPAVKNENAKKLTPLEKQILEFKGNHHDKILAIQVGYKYKFFGEDAKIVSKLINIMLIPNGDDRFDYCSIPDNRLHVHLKKILDYGHIVGVVKQTQSSFEAKGLFQRELTGIYSKATYMNEELNGEIEGNGDYILALYHEQLNYHMVTVKPITGEIIIDDFIDNELKQDLETRLSYLNPSQVLLVNCDCKEGHSCGSLMKLYSCNIIKGDEGSLNEFLLDYPNIEEYYRLNYDDNTIKCITSLMKYLKLFKLELIFTITSNISNFKDSNTMILSPNLLKNLEIFENSSDFTSKGSLFWLLNHTNTKFGERLLIKWILNPLTNKVLIEDRLNAIEDLSKEFNHFFDCLKNKIIGIDLEKLLIKIYYNKISTVEVQKFLFKFNEIKKIFKTFELEVHSLSDKYKSKSLILIFTAINEIFNDLDIEHYYNMISKNYYEDDNEITKFFELKYHDWDEISNKLKDIDNVRQEIEDETKEVAKVIGKPIKLVKNLNQDNLVEVRNSLLPKVPVDWMRINSTKTLTRFRSPKLHKLNNSLNSELDKLNSICHQCFGKFLGLINKEYFKFNQIIKKLSIFDCYLSLSAVSNQYQYRRPTILSEEQKISIKSFKNPIISSLTNFIPNDIDISVEHNRISIITGPNMGGKSSYIKSIGILVIMVQIGCYLPCESAELSIFNNVFIRMGSIDNILKGQSTFMIEMLEMLNILNNFDDKSLILLDEVGKGTGTIDGYVIAYSILKYFAQHALKPFILFITHFPQLGELCDEFRDMGSFHMDYVVENDEVIFLYKLVEGIVDSSYGLNVAKLSGIPKGIIDKAKDISREVRLNNNLKMFLHEIHELKHND